MSSVSDATNYPSGEASSNWIYASGNQRGNIDHADKSGSCQLMGRI